MKNTNTKCKQGIKFNLMLSYKRLFEQIKLIKLEHQNKLTVRVGIRIRFIHQEDRLGYSRDLEYSMYCIC